MSRPSHEPVEGYTLYSNYVFQDLHAVKAHTLESVLAALSETGVPIEAFHVKINPILGGFSGYLRNDYKHVCMAFETHVKALLEAAMLSVGMNLRLDGDR